MMSKFATPAAFFVGLAVGAGAAWYCAKEKYAHIAEQEIASVKAGRDAGNETGRRESSGETQHRRLCPAGAGGRIHRLLPHHQD